MKNYYQTLGITPDATQDHIEAAYERLLDLQERYQAHYSDQSKQDIDDAFDTLSNPSARKEYDRQLHKYIALQGEFLHAPPAARKSESVTRIEGCFSHCFGHILSHLVWTAMIILIVSALFMVTGRDFEFSSEPNTPARQISTAVPTGDQRCIARSKDDQPLQLLAQRASDAEILGTIAPGTYFRGNLAGEWFEFNDSLPGLPTHGFVRHEDIAAVTCF